MFEHRIFETELAGRKLSVEIGKICEMTNGNCIIRYGDTMLMVNVTKSAEPRDGVDFFPLSVDFEEKLYSVGKIPGGFLKREGKPSEKAILTSRLIDRPLRPLFPEGFRNDVQVVATVLSVDQDCTPDIVAMIGSSISLSISDIPFNGPTGSVLVGRVDGEFVANPNQEQRENSDLHLVVSGTKDAIMMVEAGAEEVDESVVLEGILFAHEEIKKIVAFIEDIVDEVGHEKCQVELHLPSEEMTKLVNNFAREKMREAVKTPEKMERTAKMDAVSAETLEHFEAELENFEEVAGDIEDVLHDIIKDEVRSLIVDDNVRPDNRALDEIRPIWCETGMIPRTHGSSIFTRGQTQVLNVTTLGALGDVQKLDGLDEEEAKRYMHHYNFPSYSVGETKPSRGPGRREIGHGALAERALVPVLPTEEEFPYAIRTVSETFESNGSTSQASICASTMSLMAAGVPIHKPVAGISCGLVTGDTDDDYIVLTDIQGLEDFFGDMDFKVAGTHDGITAIQMDIKIHGLTRPIVEEAIRRTKEAREYILTEVMEKCIAQPRESVGKYAPKIIQIQIDPQKIGDVVGQRGKTINTIIERTGVKIDITDEGAVSICGVDQKSMEEASRMVEIIATDFEEGQIFTGKVVSIKEFGAFIEFAPGKEGMVHISKICKERINRVEDVLTLGDKVKVVCLGKDKMGRISFSMKDVPAEEA